jgi:S-DNA-T family DNA segregation ATPase FtsK/SpoIIIE
VAFNRPPRIQPAIPREAIEIPGPQAVPVKPGGLNLLGIALPLGAVLLTVVMMSSSGGGGASYLRFLPIMLATYLATGLSYVFARRSYKRQLADARSAYRRVLSDLELDLKDRVKQTHRALLELYPGPDSCLDRVQRKDPRLGERRPFDADFLSVRLGTGPVQVSFPLKRVDKSRLEGEFLEEARLADRLFDSYSVIADGPIFAPLREIGSLGIGGPREETEPLARAAITNLVTLHWPEEVKIGLVGRTDRDETWSWIGQLPHGRISLGGKPIVLGGSQAVELLDALETELRQREQRLTGQNLPVLQTQTLILPALILVFIGLSPDFHHPGLSLLLREGKRLGVHGVFLTERPEDVPGECGAVLLLSKGRFLYQETGEAGRKAEGSADRMQQEHAARLAGGLGSIDWPEASDVSRPPDMVSLLELLGAKDLDGLPIETWWDGEPPFGYLRAPIGRTSATSDLLLDLNDREGAHGPHGLIGGMTGSGKSEILKTILLGLAATHSPFDLNFALIDYKGGAAFNELSRLPHTVGVVTDIETHASYAERVILALTGEIEQRKRLLERARLAFGFGRSHIDEYRQLTIKRPLPRLVIVFDEFAEFKGRHPEESKRLIGIARQGRSLGVHLILATQNIEAAVDPEILQNSTFRICLRVGQPQDSIQMIGIPDAVNLTRGRAYFRAQARQQFQGAYCGGPHSRANESQRPHGIVQIRRDGARRTIDLPIWGDGRELAEPDSPQYTEAQAIVERIQQAARNLRIKRPAPVWPDPLPTRLYLPDILARHFQGGWDGGRWSPCRPFRPQARAVSEVQPLIGMFDDPARQQQVLFQLDPDRGGHNLLIFGSAGTGKSTLLRTLVSAIAHTRTPASAHIYLLDFGGSSALKPLEGFPHVGAVVTRFEDERVVRLIRFIQDEISHRDALFRREAVDNYRDFNARREPPEHLPALFLILDGFGEFKRLAAPELVKSVGALLGGGAAVGLHVIVSANLQADVPNDLFANVSLRLTFNQADQTEYFRIVGRPSEAKIRQDIENPPPPGRGLLRGTPPLEFQAALPSRGESAEEQATQLTLTAQAMSAAWTGPKPRPIRALPLLVSPSEMAAAAGEPGDGSPSIALGLDFDTLAPISVDLVADGPGFLVAGVGPQSGKTTLLRSWVLGLAARCSTDRLQFAFIDFHARSLGAFRRLPHKHVYVGSAAGLEKALAALGDELERRQSRLERRYAAAAEDFDSAEVVREWPHILLVSDDYDRLFERAGESRKRLAELFTQGSDLGLSFLIAGNVSELPKDFDDPFMRGIRRLGCGFLLSGTEGIEQFNNARRPPGQPASGMPPGRGYLIKRGVVRLLQVAAYWSSQEAPEQALASAIDRIREGAKVAHAQT